MAFILTKKYVIALGAVAALAVTGLGVNYVAMPTISSYNEANVAIADAESSKSMMEARLGGLQAAKDQFVDVETINNDLSKQFPENGETQQLIEQILAGAASAGIPSNNVSNMEFQAPTIFTPPVAATPETPPAEGTEPVAETPPAEGEVPAENPEAQLAVPEGFATLDLSVSLKGTPEQIQRFITYLNSMDRVVTVREVTLSTEAEGDVTLSFTATTYVYRAIPAPGDLVEGETGEELVAEEDGDVVEG